MFGGVLDAGFAFGSGVVEIELVEHDEAGFFLGEDELGDFAVLGGDAGGEVDDQQGEVGAADGFLGAHGGENFYGGIAAGAGAEACGIDEGEVFFLEGAGEIDGIAGGAGDFGDDGALVIDDGVGEGGFAGVGLADDGDAHALGLFFFGAEGIGEGGDGGIDGIVEEVKLATVFGGYGDAGAEAEAGEF